MRKRLIAATVVSVAMLASVIPLGGFAGAVNIGNEGCTPGFWKTHPEVWEEVSPDDTLGTLGTRVAGWTFGTDNAAYADFTVLEALNARGGPGVDGATQILIRAGVAAWLNAAHEGVGYPYRRYATGLGGRQPLITLLNAALSSSSRAKMISLATTLDVANNLGCPL